MAKRGRPLSIVRRFPTNVALQQKYIDTIDRVAFDPFYGKRRIGARSYIVELALDVYFAQLEIPLKENDAED